MLECRCHSFLGHLPLLLIPGNKSKEIPVKVRDVTPPNAPTVNEVTSKHSQITGTAEVESEVNIELPDGTKLKGVTDDRGNYSIDICYTS